MKRPIIEAIEKEQTSCYERPLLKSGDSVVVGYKVKEGNRQRVQSIAGVIISTKKGGLNSSFTIRKTNSQYGEEFNFPLYSPLIVDIKKISRGKVRVRRSKLYYLRDRKGKAARLKVRYN